MTPPLTFSLLRDKNTLIGGKQTARWPDFHKPKERKKERKKERYHSLLILLKYYAANAANSILKYELTILSSSGPFTDIKLIPASLAIA